MKLLLNEKTLRFVWGGSGEYWYSRVDSQIHSSAELECEDTEDLMTNGFIPFLTISNEEVIRAYIKFLDNKKVSAVLDKLSGNEYIDTFWKYFNAYSSISEGFDEFEEKFVLEKVEQWCSQNAIEYAVNLNDEKIIDY
ncbi:MAG TPA: hypothetical protein DD364_04325 [Ruminococcaceae bacterium]|nr:hypothetical protein [Oscillospiraceae bacterium]